MRLGLLLVLLLTGCSQPQMYERENPPERLSAWQVVTIEDGQLVPRDRVVPYDLNMALFTDNAHKFRTVYVPQGQQVTYQAEDALDFPVGSIISKTFYYPKDENGQLGYHTDYSGDFGSKGLNLQRVKLIETRILVRHAEGWQALPYVWNDAQTEATLEWAGDIKPLALTDAAGNQVAFSYVVPDANQCAGCHAPNHTDGAIKPIGVKARHINKAYPFLGGQDNQLVHWQQAGMLSDLPQDLALVPRNARFDSEDSLEHKARSYLDINCGHCHNPSGAADTSGLWLHQGQQDLRRLGRCKPPVAAGRGAGHGRFSIMPGEADKSIISYRMASTDPGEMMPELGRGTVDRDGLALINSWINAMPGDCSTPGH